LAQIGDWEKMNNMLMGKTDLSCGIVTSADGTSMEVFAVGRSIIIASFCLRPVSEADAEGLGTTISPPHPPTPFVDFFF
jgi:hypothetical protein